MTDKPVMIRLSRYDSRVNINIIDQGTPIPKEKQESIFRPFYRLECSRNTKTGGTGLGLAIVKQLCDGWGWEVGFISTKAKGNQILLVIS